MHTQPSPTLGPTLTDKKIEKKMNNTIILSNPPPRLSSLNSSSRQHNNASKHISFADQVSFIDSNRTSSSGSSSARSSESMSGLNNPLSPIHELESPIGPPPPVPTVVNRHHVPQSAVAGSKSYPASRHRAARKQCMDQLKSYVESDIQDWKLTGERNNRTKLYTKAVEGSKLPVMRSDSTFYGNWTPEQICSVVQCFGARKICKV